MEQQLGQERRRTTSCAKKWKTWEKKVICSVHHPRKYLPYIANWKYNQGVGKVGKLEWFLHWWKAFPVGTQHKKGMGVCRDQAVAAAAWERQPEGGEGRCCPGSWVKRARTAPRKGHSPAERSHSNTTHCLGIARLWWSSYRLFQRAGLIYNPGSDLKCQRCSSFSYRSAIRLFLSYNSITLSTCLFSPKTHLGSRKLMLNSFGDQGLGNAQRWWSRVGGLNCWNPSAVTPFQTNFVE